MRALTSVALATLMVIALGHAHPPYPIAYYGNGQPYGAGYYDLPHGGAGRGNSVYQRNAAQAPYQPLDPNQFYYTAPLAAYPPGGFYNPPQPLPILFRQEAEAPVGEAPDGPPPAKPGGWTTILQWFAFRPSAEKPPVVAPAEETPMTAAPPPMTAASPTVTAASPTVTEASPTMTEAPPPAAAAAAAAEVTTPPSGQKAPDKPEKVVEGTNKPNPDEKESGNIESLDEMVPEDGGESPSLEEDGDSPSLEDVDDPKSSAEPLVPHTPPFFAARPSAVAPPVTPPAQQPTDGRQYVAVHPPQFFGKFDVLQQGKLPLGPGQDTGFVYLRNPPQPQLQPQFPQFQYPYQPLPFPVDPPRSRSPHTPHYYRPGVAALDFQRTLQAARQEDLESGGGGEAVGRGAFIPGSQHVDISQLLHRQIPVHQQHPGQDRREVASFPGEREWLTGQSSLTPGGPTVNLEDTSRPGLINVGPGYQNLYFFTTRGAEEEGRAEVVGGSKVKKEEIVAEAGNATTVEKEEEEEQSGPSVAQAKPQAIAVAGPGGVAAAQPIATAIVGPGGLAVAAPTATAVAGKTGGGTLTAGPAMAAVNKYLTAGKTLRGAEDFSQRLAAYGI